MKEGSVFSFYTVCCLIGFVLGGIFLVSDVVYTDPVIELALGQGDRVVVNKPAKIEAGGCSEFVLLPQDTANYETVVAVETAKPIGMGCETYYREKKIETPIMGEWKMVTGVTHITLTAIEGENDTVFIESGLGKFATWVLAFLCTIFIWLAGRLAILRIFVKKSSV